MNLFPSVYTTTNHQNKISIKYIFSIVYFYGAGEKIRSNKNKMLGMAEQNYKVDFNLIKWEENNY